MTWPEFKRHFRLALDSQQEAAVRQTSGPVLLLAVPGSGKTTVLVARLGYLIVCVGVPPQRILTVTYTVAATGDMRRRFIWQFGEACGQRLNFRTINGLCALVIRHYAQVRGTEPFALADDESQLNAAVWELLTRSGGDYPSDLLVKETRTHITYRKNRMLRDEALRTYRVEGMDFPVVYEGYQSFLRRNRLMDYDDQMIFAYRVFRQYPDILDHFGGAGPISAWTRPRTLPGSSTPSFGCWRLNTATSLWWETKIRAYMAFGRPGPKPCWSLSALTRGPVCCPWRLITAPPALLWRRRTPLSGATGAGATSTCARKTPRARPSGRSPCRTTAANLPI